MSETLALMLARTPVLGFIALFLFSTITPLHAAATSCASLKQLVLPNVTITVAATMAPGMFTPPQVKPDEKVPPQFKRAPAFCRVVATLTPSRDSDIKVEVWMPLSGWNGRFRGLGNGGFAGYIAYDGLAAAVTQGYAAASTDTGHSTTDAAWALGHPEKIVDYGFRAVHLMTLDAKTIVKAFYGDGPRHSYFASCSNGGRQALMEAQRYPDDYDGIIAGAPANAWVPMLSGGLKLVQTLDGPGYIPPTRIPAISKAVLAACDGLDGLKDGILNDPRQCHFDPSVLLCQGKESDDCLTKAQVSSLKLIYSGAHDASGKQIFPGLLPGAEGGEGGWQDWITGSQEGKSAAVFFVGGYFADMVYDKKDWDLRHANIDQAMKLAYEKTGDSLDAMSPDLKPFLGRGGKLILYHGWNDPGISPLNSVHYFDSVIEANGRQAAARLYMVPGMQHCGGGPGATSFGQRESGPRRDRDHDIFTSLVDWVEDGRAPGTIIATKYGNKGEAESVEMTRPLCPYPQAAKYKGNVDPNVADSFACAAETK
ncbi:MAG TPA: tannase/feruloyl esterase family alpha/beta hydrolase [Candidatus Sulfotelmatobacter sp.]|nr:tannase/feruloyl esterase family alpha/beta hydrolase [Candidatus Sulfotelmatobacter sp.]